MEEGGGDFWFQHTQTLKLRFLYVTDSTLKPIVGMVVTTSPIYVTRSAVVDWLAVERRRGLYVG